MVEWLALIITTVGTLFGGAWTLLQVHFKLREKLHHEEKDAVNNANYVQNKTMERLEKLIERLDGKQETHEKVVANALTSLTREMSDLRLDLKTASVEWKANRDHFSQLIERLTEVIQVGPNSVLVRDKKKL